jgi:hypothetical protein
MVGGRVERALVAALFWFRVSCNSALLAPVSRSGWLLSVMVTYAAPDVAAPAGGRRKEWIQGSQKLIRSAGMRF